MSRESRAFVLFLLSLELAQVPHRFFSVDVFVPQLPSPAVRILRRVPPWYGSRLRERPGGGSLFFVKARNRPPKRAKTEGYFVIGLIFYPRVFNAP